MGLTDEFEYVIGAAGYGPDETAKLSFTIGAPDYGDTSSLAEDSATASVKFVNVVSDPVTTNNVAQMNLGLLDPTDTTSFNFTVGANETDKISIRLAVAALVEVLPSFSVTIRDAVSNAIIVPKITANAVLDVAGLLGPSATFDIPNNFGAGTYKVELTASTLISLSSAINVSTVVTTTELTNFEIASGGTVSGNILDNDSIDTEFYRLLVAEDADGVVNDLVGLAPVVLDGEYGKLTIDAEGNYSYVADTNQPRFTVAVTDSFKYGVVQADGSPAVYSELDIILQPI